MAHAPEIPAGLQQQHDRHDRNRHDWMQPGAGPLAGAVAVAMGTQGSVGPGTGRPRPVLQGPGWPEWLGPAIQR